MTSADGERPRVVLFSGGTACRSINIALSRQPLALTRVVPAWDSGGSSKALRETFDMLPVGDIRQALMTMAHGEGRAGEVVKICNARLSEQIAPRDLRFEFDFYADGRHPLLQRMEPAVREAILNYLNLFRSRLPDDFDFRNGSIGNFILAGAYFAHGRNINRAIAVFRGLCAIEGHVWPASSQDDVQLAAKLKNGVELARQDEITRLEGDNAVAGIAEIRLTAGRAGRPAVANDAVLEAVTRADAIVFGPGSFFTSILPHLLVGGLAQAIATNANAPKIFIGNILECAETRGARLSSLLDMFASTFATQAGSSNALSHVVSNRDLFPFEKMVGRFAYLKNGDLDAFCEQRGIVNIESDFEDAWTRGQHDGEAVAATLAALLTRTGLRPTQPVAR